VTRLSAGWHPKSRFIDVNGWTAHCVDMGSSTVPIVLLHGFLVSSWAWRHNLYPLSGHHRVIAPCQKGFGWTDKREDPYTLSSLGNHIVACLDALGVEKAHVIGNSLGGAVGLYMAANFPQRVDHLVLVNAAGIPFRRGVNLLTRTLSKWLAPAARGVGRDAIFRLLLRTYCYPRNFLDDRYMRGFMAPLSRSGSYRAALRVMSNLNRGLREMYPQLSGIQHPTRIIWGGRDRLVPLKAGEILAARLPQSELIVFHDSHHCPMEEEPERFNECVLDFLPT